MKYKILVVDDEPIALRAVSRILKDDSLQIITCTNYHDALEAHQKHPEICVAILDVMLQSHDMTHDYNGIALMKRLRENNEDLKVIIVSGNPEAVTYAKLSGADESFTKPITPNELSVVVNHYVKLCKNCEKFKAVNNL